MLRSDLERLAGGSGRRDQRRNRAEKEEGERLRRVLGVRPAHSLGGSRPPACARGRATQHVMDALPGGSCSETRARMPIMVAAPDVRHVFAPF